MAVISEYAARLPIGIIMSRESPRHKGGYYYTHSKQCATPGCHVRGHLDDVVDHVLLEHGLFSTGLMGIEHSIRYTPIDPHNLAPPGELGLPTELVEILSEVEGQQSKVNEFFDSKTCTHCTFCFVFRQDLKIVLTFEWYSRDYEQRSHNRKTKSDLSIFVCKGGGFFQKLMHCAGGDSRKATFLKDSALRETIRENFGLSKTTPIHFVAGLLSQCCGSNWIRNIDLAESSYNNYWFGGLPIVCEAITFLQEALSKSQNPLEEL